MVRTTVVTGATGGIGRAVVEAVVARGDQVFAIGRSPEKLDALCAEMPGVRPVLTDFSQTCELPPELARLGSVDALVLCAGIAEVASVAETSGEVWDETFAINVISAAALIRDLLPSLRRAQGRVVFVNIAAGTRAVPQWSAYVGSKAALRELADSLREEEASYGIRVTSIYPSGTDTELLRKVRAKFGQAYDAAACVKPETLASYVVLALGCPSDAHLTELSIQPAPAGTRG